MFVFSCFVEAGPVEVHVLVSGDFCANVMIPRSRSRTSSLRSSLPEGRSEQYLIYVVLAGMLVTHFDALSDVDGRVEQLMQSAVDP